jgi:hypothetical protein
MSLSGRGMLVNFTNIPSEVEQDFNKWYDREHLEERVAIPGFLWATRYEAIDAPQKYLALYLTENPGVLSSKVYLDRLANQTEWSLRTLAQFQDATRALVTINVSKGYGRGSAIAFVRIQPSDTDAKQLRETIASSIEPLIQSDGILSAHVLESGPAGTVPPGTSTDWFIVVEASSPSGARSAADVVSRGYTGHLVSAGTYRVLWSLSKDDL